MKRASAWIYAAVLAVTTGPVLAGSDSAALKSLVDGAKTSHSDTLLVIHDDKVLVDYRRPGAPYRPIEMMSSTKSLVGLAVGRLITQGKLRSVDEPVSDFYPEWKQGNKAKITLRMLLNHTSGLQNEALTSAEIYPAPDGFQLALAAELSDPPGTRFRYNNKAMNLLAGVIEKAAGEPMDTYIAKELLAPMGIQLPPWDDRDQAGHPRAMSGWMATSEDAAKVGKLVLDQGRWQGKQLIDAGYMALMIGQSTPLTQHYGLLWWRQAEGVYLKASAIDHLRAAGVDGSIVDKLSKVSPKRYANLDEFFNGLPALGIDPKLFIADVKAHHMGDNDLFEPSPIVAWEANGYLGNYVVIVPKAHLIAVRQIAVEEEPEAGQPWPYNYDDFTRRVIKLGQSYNSDLAVDKP